MSDILDILEWQTKNLYFLVSKIFHSVKGKGNQKLVFC